MDEKELRNIFKKFYRTKKAETSGEVGTGIGLSIVEQIVTAPWRADGGDQHTGEGILFYDGVTAAVPLPSRPASWSTLDEQLSLRGNSCHVC